jgi:thiamine-monophosphate kinase
MVRRAGARPGDAVFVSGVVGDGVLGLAVARGEFDDPAGGLLERYRRPVPRLDLRETLRGWATAAADVSDGLVADAGHIAEASGVRLAIDLERIPLSAAARRWMAAQPDPAASLLTLATGGDDYEVVCTAPPQAPMVGFTAIGEATPGAGIEVSLAGRRLDPGAGGWRHL